MLSLKGITVTVARTAITAAPIATLTLLASFAATPAAASIVVDANSTPCVSATTHYTTIQAAVTAAPSGATIQVCPGTYAEQVTIATPLTLHGVTYTAGDAGAAVITIPGGTFGAPYPFTQITIQASGVTLSNIGVDGTNTNTIGGCYFGISLTGISFAAGSSGTLNQVALRNHYVSDGSGGYCGTGTAVSAATAASVTITDSSVRGYDESGINVTATSTVTVKTTTVAPVTPGSGCVYANAPTVVVSSNQMGDCESGAYVASTVQATVSGNTVIGPSSALYGDATYGVFCFQPCTGLTVSGNQIFNTRIGFSIKTSGGVGGVVFENNDVSGTTYGVYLFGQPGNTINNNTFNDAQYGVYGASGNTLSGNTYRTVTTLTQ